MMWIMFFDLDGTLIDTSERHYKVYKDILGLHRVSTVLSKREFWEQKRMGRTTVGLLPKNSPRTLIKSFDEEWFERIERLEYLRYDKLLPQSLDVLSALKERNELILVTLRHNKETLFWELDSFGLTNYFTKILVGSPLLRDKASLIKEYLKTSRGKNGLIIGDSEIDVHAGNEIGMLTIVVTYGIRSKDFLSKLKPRLFLDNLCEISKILEKIGICSNTPN
jgi:phosphoglycolate phosphatase